jgi:inner membrane protein
LAIIKLILIMASAFSHAIAAVAIGKISRAARWPGDLDKVDLKFWLIAIFCAVSPDFDAIGFWLGVPYDSVWGHRGITHSLFFAGLLSYVMIHFFYSEEKVFSRRWLILFLFFFAVTASHGILDAMTDGGRGVAFFAPFNNARYFFPFRPIRVSPISITRFFSGRGWEVLKSEFVWVWIPSFILMAVASLIKKLRTT